MGPISKHTLRMAMHGSWDGPHSAGSKYALQTPACALSRCRTYKETAYSHLHPHLGVQLKSVRVDTVQARDVKRCKRGRTRAAAHQRLPAKQKSVTVSGTCDYPLLASVFPPDRRLSSLYKTTVCYLCKVGHCCDAAPRCDTIASQTNSLHAAAKASCTCTLLSITSQ